MAANVFRNLGVDPGKVRREVENAIQADSDLAEIDKLLEAPQAEKVWQYASEEARNLNHNYVGTEHVLLGLLREAEGVAARVLIRTRGRRLRRGTIRRGRRASSTGCGQAVPDRSGNPRRQADFTRRRGYNGHSPGAVKMGTGTDARTFCPSRRSRRAP
ncbi:MAG: hypothetical protein L0Y71_20850 [Gemmataceae bacterium]|nr:hypothetical protein [Gemmataceae bacterium]